MGRAVIGCAVAGCAVVRSPVWAGVRRLAVLSAVERLAIWRGVIRTGERRVGCRLRPARRLDDGSAIGDGRIVFGRRRRCSGFRRIGGRG
jgi:hypothetical protein